MARDTADLPAFGSQVASDYVAPEYDEDAIWIRNFTKPMTLIRICPYEAKNAAGKPVYGPDAWEWEWEHYVPGFGSFPCSKRYDVPCPGCADSEERVRKGRRQYYFNALDEEGELRVFKIGKKLWETFQGRHERAMARDAANVQSLSTRDYMVNRMGKDLETTYDPEPGDVYEVDWPEELHDIKEILRQQYAAALEYYSGEGDDEPPAAKSWAAPAAEGKEDAAPARKIATKKAAPAKKAAAKKAEPEPEPEPEPADDFGPLGQTPSEEDLDDATTDDLKKFLTGRKAEFPARAARSRLLEIATEVAAEPPY